MDSKRPYSLAVHGGAGTILREALNPELEQEYREALVLAIAAGEGILQNGGSAVDAVEAAVAEMEDCALFNAGKGAVFTHEGQHELDASIMDGRRRRAGAVAGLKHIRNPIRLCRHIMDHSEHVLMIGSGAEQFALEHGFGLVENSYFTTEFRREQWLRLKDTDNTALDHSTHHLRKYGTVGAVAYDMKGNLAAATSTGGVTNKRFGRVGDSPIIGAGTYAENGICAVSATGYGEYFMRGVAAYEVAALIKHAKLSLEAACNEVIFEIIPELGGDGGLIAINNQGDIYMPFNTKGMYRAAIRENGELIIGIYEE
jgi:L-asparaginase / beta-aspartyl-peptidase